MNTTTTAQQFLTDLGNAERLIDRHGDDMLYCGAWGAWLIYNGRQWQRDVVGAATAFAAESARSWWGEVEHAAYDDRKALVGHCQYSEKARAIDAALRLAQPMRPVMPDDLDADPWTMNVANGTVCLRTGKLRAHDRGDMLTKICRAHYDPAARAPVFEAFLRRIFRTYPAIIDYLRRWFGYCCTGQTSEQLLVFMFGSGANGKSTLLDAIQYVMGDYAAKADRDLLVAMDGSAHPTNIADLGGRRLVVAAETNEGQRWDEGRLKDLTGETILKARFMRQDFFEFRATHKLVLYSNHRPIVRGSDHGFWRRMRLVPFIETIADQERDPDLPIKLQAEASGILAWLVRGCLEWQREGLGLPAEVERATQDYRTEMDSIGQFLDESCTFGDREVTSAKELYAAYQHWCEDAGEHPLSQKRLGMELSKRNLRSDRDSYSGRKTWRGIGLKGSEM